MWQRNVMCVQGRIRVSVELGRLQDMAPLQRFYCPQQETQGIVSVMRPMSHEFLGYASSTTRTSMAKRTSQFLTQFLHGLCHLCRSCIIVRYSLKHLFRNRSVMYCTCLHLLRMYESSFLNKPGGIIGLTYVVGH